MNRCSIITIIMSIASRVHNKFIYFKKTNKYACFSFRKFIRSRLYLEEEKTNKQNHRLNRATLVHSLSPKHCRAASNASQFVIQDTNHSNLISFSAQAHPSRPSNTRTIIPLVHSIHHSRCHRPTAYNENFRKCFSICHTDGRDAHQRNG